MSVERIRSADGTSIAFERTGEGPALILVGGAFCDRSAATSGTPLAAALAGRFTVFSYDRRGRGDSEDAAPYAIDRELEDLSAVMKAAGGSASVFGNSAGGLLALDAVVRGLPISKLAMCGPPVVLDPARARSLESLATQLDETVARGDRAEAAQRFLSEVMQMPPPVIEGMRSSPMWAGLEGLAHTLSYDLRITARGAARLEFLSSIQVPTIVMNGATSPPWMLDAIQALARAIPGTKHHTLEGQPLAVSPAALAQALKELL